jgi:hypothetical protein
MVVDEAAGYLHIVSGASPGPACDFLLSDEGVLYEAVAGGAWRCLGVIDPEELLAQMGLLDGSAVGLVAEEVPRARTLPTAA